MIAAHLGIVNENDINDMSIPFFNEVLKQLGRKLNYDSISNLYGNSFCKDATKYIQEAYPLSKPNTLGTDFTNMLASAPIIKTNQILDSKTAEKVIEQDLGDVSWAEGLL